LRSMLRIGSVFVLLHMASDSHHVQASTPPPCAVEYAVSIFNSIERSRHVSRSRYRCHLSFSFVDGARTLAKQHTKFLIKWPHLQALHENARTNSKLTCAGTNMQRLRRCWLQLRRHGKIQGSADDVAIGEQDRPCKSSSTGDPPGPRMGLARPQLTSLSETSPAICARSRIAGGHLVRAS
jgi:hypothetical protein